jgi:hypothetical protein
MCYLRQFNISGPDVNISCHGNNKMSQHIAEKCDQQYISVLYDLVIALAELLGVK